MTDREKLMKLLEDGQACPGERDPFDQDCDCCRYQESKNCFLEKVADYLIANGVNFAPAVDAAPVVHGRWEDVKETSLYVPDMKYTVTHTAETCSACKVRIGFIGSKPYLYDNICPNCGARMDGANDG